ncbi:MAG: hypothetical protein P1V36_17385 [Planctomycetota bacterium]|nr:hypothetical protein [Planctomycetota bacterium]
MLRNLFRIKDLRMTDHLDAAGPSPRDDQAAFEALLADALAAEERLAEERLAEALAEGRSAEALPEALPEGLRARALAAPELADAEALLADALEGESEALWVARQTPTTLSPGLRRAALAAYERAETPALTLVAPKMALASPAPAARADRPAVRTEPLRARRLAPMRRLRMASFAAAAVLLLGLGVVLFGGGDEAHAGLQLRALARADTAGSVQTSRVQPLYFAALGQTFTPGRDELLRFSLAEDAMVVVGSGDAVRVSRAARALDGLAPESAVLRLESGEAQLATRGHPIPLLIDGIGLLVLEEGAAHVAVDAGDGSHAPAVALYEGTVARFQRADGSAAVPLVGPTRVLLEATRRRPLSTRLFRAAKVAGAIGRTRRGRQDVRLLVPEASAARSTAEADRLQASARFLWRPEQAVRQAHALEIALRAPAGTRVQLAQAGPDGRALAPIAATVARAGVSATGAAPEPGVATVTLSLPEGWFDRLPQGRIDLRLDVPLAPGAEGAQAARVVAWFDGASLVFGPARSRVQAEMPGQDGRNAGRDG